MRERFIDPMEAWATAHHTLFRFQGYGIPPATISSSAGVDLPEGEGSQWKTVRASRWAASIAHLYDRPVVSSETWTWLHSPVFRATPLDVKAEADLHFLQGINQLVGHGWPYTADGVAYPGWRFYAAGVFNEKNPWWIVMPDLARYLQRVSFLLRQGRPVNDVAVYLPVDDAWAHFVPGKVGSLIEALSQQVGPDLMPAILAAGFNLDFIDDGVLNGPARVDQRRARDRPEPVPRRSSCPTSNGSRRARFALSSRSPQQGVRIVATRRMPALAPGYRAGPADHADVAASAARLFRGAGATGAFVERDTDAGSAIAARVQPDMAVSQGASDLGVVHRRTDAADIYFVANTSNVPVTTQASFRTSGSRAEHWDPITGEAAPIGVRRTAGGETATIALDLAPYESTVIVFPTGPSTRPADVPAPVRATDTAPLDISTGWRVTIGRLVRRVEHAAIVDGRGAHAVLLGRGRLRAAGGRAGLDAAARPCRAARLRSAAAHRRGRTAGPDAGLGRCAGAGGGRRLRQRRARRLGVVPAVRRSTSPRTCGRAPTRFASTSRISRSITWQAMRCPTTSS